MVLTSLNFAGVRGSRGGDVAIERRGRDAEAVRDLYHADIGVGEQGTRGFKSRSFSVSFGGRLPVRSARRAAARLAWVRSRIRLRSNSASAPNMWKTKPSLRGRRVEGFGQAAKPDAPYPQIFDAFDQLLH
jgi:hypothetical protein